MAKAPVKKTPKQVVEEFLSVRKVLVADEVSSSRTGISKIISGLGAKVSNLTMVGSYSDALKVIDETSPQIILCDFDIGKGRGMELLQTQRQKFEDTQHNLFVLVTGNSSQSAVVQAAEEDIDMFLIKPYTIANFERIFSRAVLDKIQPSPYVQKIAEGKDHLKEMRFEQALEAFSAAKEMHHSPALAHYYIGLTFLEQKQTDKAKAEFDEGLKIDPIHFKCLTGLYDALMVEKKFREAYDKAKQLTKYFPASPKRLASIIRLAVVTKQTEDMDRYYQVFSEIEQRSNELVRYVCAGLVICAKTLAKTGDHSKALEMYRKAGVACQGNPKILREIITALVESKQAGSAEEFLGRFHRSEQASPDFYSCDLLISEQVAETNKTVQKARKLVNDGVQDPTIYEVLIRSSVQGGFEDAAESSAYDAAKIWPKMKDFFLSLLEPEKSKESEESDEES